MDPPHITEFASERYFSKLSQLNDSAQPQDAGSSVSHATSTPSQSTFILPLRAAKSLEVEPEVVRPVELKRPEKSRLFNLRSKVSILQSKSAPTPPQPQEQPRLSTTSNPEVVRRRRYADDHDPPPLLFIFFSLNVSISYHLPTSGFVQQKHRLTIISSLPLDQLFLGLPNELQIQIVASLPLTDLLNLRRTSKSWHALITVHEAPIVRHHLDTHIPAYALRLYPIPDPSKASLYHLCGLWHRLHVAAKLSYLMCEWITKEIFLRTTEAQKAEFAPQKERMRRRLIPLLFTVFHFFEMYRKLHIQHMVDHDGHGLLDEPYTLNPIEAQIMSMYDDQTLLRVHQVFPLVISSFCRRLRPPSYAGRVERSLRGYLREKPPDEVHMAILCLGGLRQVLRFWEIRGYNHRRGAVDVWYSDLIKEPIDPAPTKSKRGLMRLGRKKSSMTMKDTSSGSLRGANGTRGGAAVHREEDPGLIFNTSLAEGMPMGNLAPEHIRRLLPDLPGLQQIWLATAEALILDRKIVERTQDIKRNAQVMLELIREDGIDEEEEWLYGRGTPESVRPLLEAIEEEDAMDGVTDA